MRKLTLACAALAALTVIPAQAVAMPAGMKVTCVDGPPQMRETYVFERGWVTIDGVRQRARPSASGPGLVVGVRTFAASPDFKRWGELGANIGRMEWMRCRV